MSYKNSNNGGSSNSSFFIALLSTLLGTGGLATLITAIIAARTTINHNPVTPTPSPSVSTSENPVSSTPLIPVPVSTPSPSTDDETKQSSKLSSTLTSPSISPTQRSRPSSRLPNLLYPSIPPVQPQKSPEIIPSLIPSPTETYKPAGLTKYCLGIKYTPITKYLSSQKSYEIFSKVAVITDILNDYPIASSGLKQGDGLVAVENNPIESSEQLSNTINAQTGGRPIRLYVFRPDKYAIDPQKQVIAFEPPYEELTAAVPVKPCKE